MSMRHLRLLLVIAVATLVITGCQLFPVANQSPDSCHPPDQSTDLASIDGLYVLPDDGRAPLLDEIDNAFCTIDVTAYLISDDEIIEALGRAEARGVTVRVLYEETPFGGFGGQVDTAEQLSSYGVEIRPGSSSFRFTHAKYLVIDGQVGIITNQNLTTSAFEQNREFGVITTYQDDVAALAGIFDADWNSTTSPAPSHRLVVSPHNARASLIDLIDSAERNIRLYVEVIRDDEIIAALTRAVSRDVSVQLIVNEPDDDLDLDVYGELSAVGVDIRVAEHIYIHAKAMMIDESRILIGSHNPTATSIDDNREVSLVLDDRVAIERTVATFDRDWTRSVPWSATSVHTNVHAPLALDMTIMYGYRVRTVPSGLARVNCQQGQVSELRGDDTITALSWQ